MTITLKVSDNTKEKMKDFYKDTMRPKTPPYAVFQADSEDTVVTLYESGKAVFQGISADIDAAMWRQVEKNLNPNKNIEMTNSEDKKKDKYVYLSKSRIRKICEFMKGTKPHLIKTEMINTFKKAIGFGYDFLSTSIENETNINYNLAVENLTNIMEVLDEMFPNETSINLVEMCQNRFKELSLGLYNL